MRRSLVAAAIAAACISIIGYLVYQQATKSTYALEIDATRDTTDVGIQYRVRMTNVGTHQLTGLIVDFGPKDNSLCQSLHFCTNCAKIFPLFNINVKKFY